MYEIQYNGKENVKWKIMTSKMDLDELEMVNGGNGGELSGDRKERLYSLARKFKKKGMSLGWILSNIKPEGREAAAAYLHSVWDSIEV